MYLERPSNLAVPGTPEAYEQLLIDTNADADTWARWRQTRAAIDRSRAVRKDLDAERTRLGLPSLAQSYARD